MDIIPYDDYGDDDKKKSTQEKATPYLAIYHNQCY